MENAGIRIDSYRAGPPSRQGRSGAIAANDLVIDLETMVTTISGEEIRLTVQEYDLLVLLAQDVGRTVPQKRLALALWREFRPQQERHLSVLVARLRTKIAASRELRLETHRKRGYGLIPLTASNRIEVLKQAKDGLDVLDDILRYASTGAEIHPDDAERMKWYGVFQRRQTPGFFMFRLRIPNGILTSEQVTAIGQLSNQYGRGVIDITTRQNVQLRWIQIKDVPEIFRVLDSVGLEYRQSGMDNVRNITGCPMAGLDPDEVVDASPMARELQDAIVGNKAFSNLPRKFNISISGCRHDCATSQINDLSLTPASRDGRLGFNIGVGGMGGRSPAFAVPLDVFVEASAAPALCAALIQLYRDEGRRENRQSARMRFLVDNWGVERLRSELKKRYGPLERAGHDELTSFAGDHLGVSRQKQAGLNTVGCLVPVGRINGDDLIEFGRLADCYGSGELRLTNNQDLLIVDVHKDDMRPLLAEQLLQKYSPAPPNWRRRSVSCTGIDFCHYAQIDTKRSAEEFAAKMEELLPIDSPLRVHWSGCQHGCGQHYVGDIGLLASHNQVGNAVVPVVDVFVGGTLGKNPRLARRALTDVPLTELPERLAEYLRRDDSGLIMGNA
jgi:ferredoxin-nitrite reductase